MLTGDSRSILRSLIACLFCVDPLHDDVRERALLSCPAARSHELCQHLQEHRGAWGEPKLVHINTKCPHTKPSEAQQCVVCGGINASLQRHW